jgi:hypothetical protein
MPTALSLGGAWDREFVAFGERPPTDDATHLGGEVGIADVLFLRVGRADSRHTTGWGIAIPIGDWVAVRYDHARLAPMNGFDATTSRAWSVWLEPLRIVGWRR